MTSETYYLKPNVLAEPLIGGWYAWTHLIPPVNAGMNIVDRHLSILRSFVQAPQVHAAAVKNPAMLGGPFVSYGSERVGDVKKLIEWTETEQRDLIVLARAVKELDDMLRKEARGFSLEPLYARVPEPLRGYVELVYDLNNAPSFRLIEPLLYHSRYYNPAFQTLALSLTEEDGDRPFVLSTPRLPEQDLLILDLPFARPEVDEALPAEEGPPDLRLHQGDAWGGGCRRRVAQAVPHDRAPGAIPALRGAEHADPLLRARLHPGGEPGRDDPERPGHQLRLPRRDPPLHLLGFAGADRLCGDHPQPPGPRAARDDAAATPQDRDGDRAPGGRGRPAGPLTQVRPGADRLSRSARDRRASSPWRSRGAPSPACRSWASTPTSTSGPRWPTW